MNEGSIVAAQKKHDLGDILRASQATEWLPAKHMGALGLALNRRQRSEVSL